MNKRIGIFSASFAALVLSGCGIPHRHQTEASYRYPSPSLARDEESMEWWGNLRVLVKALRIQSRFEDDKGGWVHSRYRDRAKQDFYEIAHVKGDNGALKVQCKISAKGKKTLDLFVHHPVLCGDGSVQGQIWEEYWEDNKVQTFKDELKPEQRVQYDWNYKSLDNRGRATRGECQTHWVGGARKAYSHLGDWMLALLKTRGAGYFRVVAHTEIDRKPIYMKHEHTGMIFEHLGTSRDLEYDYDIRIDLRHGKRNLAKVLEACGY